YIYADFSNYTVVQPDEPCIQAYDRGFIPRCCWRKTVYVSRQSEYIASNVGFENTKGSGIGGSDSTLDHNTIHSPVSSLETKGNEPHLQEEQQRIKQPASNYQSTSQQNNLSLTEHKQKHTRNPDVLNKSAQFQQLEKTFVDNRQEVEKQSLLSLDERKQRTTKPNQKSSVPNVADRTKSKENLSLSYRTKGERSASEISYKPQVQDKKVRELDSKERKEERLGSKDNLSSSCPSKIDGSQLLYDKLEKQGEDLFEKQPSALNFGASSSRNAVIDVIFVVFSCVLEFLIVPNFMDKQQKLST
ncbi:unnamed protein product, partial [Didymodactylos carnosus]